jgi:hypothetical protein
MAYDPKKKRPKAASLDAVVDEIFGDEPESKPAKSPKKSVAKKTPTKKAVSRKTAKSEDSDSRPSTASEETSAPSIPSESEGREAAREGESLNSDNSPANGAPLIMQPQVWVATGIAAILVLFFMKRRKKR